MVRSWLRYGLLGLSTDPFDSAGLAGLFAKCSFGRNTNSGKIINNSVP